MTQTNSSVRDCLIHVILSLRESFVVIVVADQLCASVQQLRSKHLAMNVVLLFRVSCITILSFSNSHTDGKSAAVTTLFLPVDILDR